MVPTSDTTASVTAGGPLLDLSQGSMGVNWTAADATAREWVALILGADTGSLPCGGAAPPVIETRVTRRLRRFQLPTQTNLWMFLRRLEFLCQQGVGLSTGQGSAPVLMLRLSRDGGSTWGNEIQMNVGPIGRYDFRTYVNNLGRGRNFVAEVTDTDPVFSVLLDCYIDLEGGTS